MFDELISKLNFTNIDLYLREVNEDNFSYKLIFYSSLIDEEMLMELQRSIRLSKEKSEVISKLDNTKIKVIDDVEETINLLHEGQVILYIVKEQSFILIDIRKTPTRSIEESEVEKSIRGSKDGFNEFSVKEIADSVSKTEFKKYLYVLVAIVIASVAVSAFFMRYMLIIGGQLLVAGLVSTACAYFMTPLMWTAIKGKHKNAKSVENKSIEQE